MGEGRHYLKVLSFEARSDKQQTATVRQAPDTQHPVHASHSPSQAQSGIRLHSSLCHQGPAHSHEEAKPNWMAPKPRYSTLNMLLRSIPRGLRNVAFGCVPPEDALSECKRKDERVLRTAHNVLWVENLTRDYLEQRLRFLAKHQMANVLGSAISGAATQLCHCSSKADRQHIKRGYAEFQDTATQKQGATVC